MFCLIVENWSKLHLLWRILGCLLSHLLCRRFSGAACRQAQRRQEFNIYALKGFWEVSAGVSCLGFGVWSRGYGLPWLPGSVVSWGESVAFFSWGPKAPLSSGWLFADVCLWRMIMVRRSFAGWFIGRCPEYFFILVGNANLGALYSLCFFWVWCFSACVGNICLCICLIVCGVIYGLAWFGILVRCILFLSNGDA